MAGVDLMSFEKEQLQDQILNKVFCGHDPTKFMRQTAHHNVVGYHVCQDILARQPDALIVPTGYESVFTSNSYLQIRDNKDESWRATCEEIRAWPDFLVSCFDSRGERVIFYID